MSKNNNEEVPHSRVNAVNFFLNYVATNKSFLVGKKVYDISSGSGYIAQQFSDVGADVKIFDLFPEQNTLSNLRCEKIDLQQVFPIQEAAADVVICAETIEHLPDQYFFFKEVARITKQGGVILLTTPNPSSLRSRLSQFLMESEHYGHAAPNETDAFARWGNEDKGYFSKLFISGILRLRTLAALQKLSIRKVHPSPKSSTAILLLIVFYPFIYFFSRKNLKKQLRQDSENAAIYHEIAEINTSMNVLLGKHLILEFIKR
jgi:SAM-dependent methyltransferase